MRVALLTLGCKVNQAEMLDWEQELSRGGHELVGLDESPEVCVINTCTVTSRSDYESRQLIRRASRAGARVLVTGCYSELNREKVLDMDGVAGVLSNTEKSQIISRIGGVSAQAEAVSTVSVPVIDGLRSRKMVKVQDGCDYSCTYCLVWRARGKSRSVPVEDAVARVREAVEEGYQEVVLTGVHLGLYGQDMERPVGLSELVENILENTDVARIRLSSLEINEVDDRLVELLGSGRVCRHLHLPLQSGDERVLSLMKRQYSADFFRTRLLEIMERAGDVALGTDIIAGFPGETIEMHENTVALVRDLPFTYFHVFPYSPRPGTVAARMGDQVPKDERKRRAAELREISDRKKAAYLEAQVGRVLPVLVEACAESVCRGTSDNYLKVQGSVAGDMKGTIVPIRILAVDGNGLSGEPVS